jgi:N-acetylglutamate synthase-like GNAT family acetyltransferase
MASPLASDGDIGTTMTKSTPNRSQPSCVIRRAAAGDAEAIERLYRELVTDPLVSVLPDHVAAISQSPTSFLLIAESLGEVCGTVLLTICPDAMYRRQPFGVVENIVVTRAKRGSGIGRLLLSQVEDLAITHDCTKLMLLSSVSRETAHHFFRSCGFAGDTKHAFVKYRTQFTAS